MYIPTKTLLSYSVVNKRTNSTIDNVLHHYTGYYFLMYYYIIYLYVYMFIYYFYFVLLDKKNIIKINTLIQH